MDLPLGFQKKKKNRDRCQLHIWTNMEQLAVGVAANQSAVVVPKELRWLKKKMFHSCASP